MTTDNARQAGMREAADFVAGKADDYANEFGYGVGGTLCFDRQEKMDHYTTLTELAEEIRVLASQSADSSNAGMEFIYEVRYVGDTRQKGQWFRGNQERGKLIYEMPNHTNNNSHNVIGDHYEARKLMVCIDRAENTPSIAASGAVNCQRAKTIARAVAAWAWKWPEDLTSGVMFYEGERITKAEFLTEVRA